MFARARWLGAAVALLAGLSGCPLTDDYYVDPSLTAGAAAGDRAAGDAGAAGGPTSGAGNAQGGSEPIEPGSGGAPASAGTAAGLGGTGGDANAGASPSPACTPSTERCNGHDDNCNDLIDEQACNNRMNGTLGCAGFVLPSRPNHGYMLCPTTPKTYAEAQRACGEQDMRLAWLETEEENTAVAAKVYALTTNEVTIGANDIDVEGEWIWDGADGFQFWQGNENGQPVGGAFSNWTQGTPNDDNNEDCGVMNPLNGVWGDRACTIQYAYLCEEPE